MGLRKHALPAALYSFGVFAVVMLFLGSGLFDVPSKKALIFQYLLFGLAAAAIGVVVCARYSLYKIRNQLFFVKRHLDTTQNRLMIRDEDATLLNRINELTERFSETRNLEAVLHQAVSTLREVLHVDVIVLQLYSHQESRFFLRIEEGVEDLELGARMYKEVLELRRSGLVNNLANSKNYAHLAEQGFRSLLVAPLVHWLHGGGQEAIGLVAVIGKGQRDFTAHDQHLLSAFTKQAGMIIENAHLYEKTQAMAIRDGLTNLYNFRRFKEVLDEELAKCTASGQSVGLIMGDIDYFKKFNDNNGHQQGDVVLRGVADIMLRVTRGADLIARYGGEEFVVILPDTELEGALAAGENIRRGVSDEKFPGEEKQPSGDLTMTLGLACYPRDAQSATDLIEAADKALYEGKRTGRNKVVVFRNMKKA
jgi:diguanylate cyclase (GGDEF)-like protein